VANRTFVENVSAQVKEAEAKAGSSTGCSHPSAVCLARCGVPTRVLCLTNCVVQTRASPSNCILLCPCPLFLHSPSPTPPEASKAGAGQAPAATLRQEPSLVAPTSSSPCSAGPQSPPLPPKGHQTTPRPPHNPCYTGPSAC